MNRFPAVLVRAALLAGFCAALAGCQSTSPTIPFFARHGSAVGLARQPTPQTQTVLDPGMEVRWQVRTAKDEPGQVNVGLGIIGPDGTMVIGPYGACRVAGLNVNQATTAVEKHLADYLKAPKVQLTLAGPQPGLETISVQRPAREANLAPVTWRGAGSRAAPSLTTPAMIPDAALSVTAAPRTSMTVQSSNSDLTAVGNTYQIITDGHPFGEQTIRVTLTGNDNVRDALRLLGEINKTSGHAPVAVKPQVWVARSAGEGRPDALLAVDWTALQRGESETNYPIMPGDRVYFRTGNQRANVATAVVPESATTTNAAPVTARPPSLFERILNSMRYGRTWRTSAP
jgi:hypothetical protein